MSRKFLRRPEAVEIYCKRAAAEAYAKNLNCFCSVCRRLKVLSRKFWRRPEAVEIYCERAAPEVYAKNFSRTVLLPSRP